MVVLFFGKIILQRFSLVRASDFGSPDCTAAHSQIWVDTLNKVFFWLLLFSEIIFHMVNINPHFILHFMQYSLVD